MGALAIELSDSGVLVADPAAILAQSPAFALIGERGLERVGEAARAQARLRPLDVNTRFWRDLSAAALPRPVPGATSNAEIAQRHLAQIWEGVSANADQVLLLVPGTMTSEQLGLALGMARNLAIPISAMIDSAVAAAARACPGACLVHLDLHWQRGVLTELRQDSRLRRGTVRSLDGVGLSDLWDLLARVVSDAFVRATRFDPSLRADWEQLMYDRLPEWLAASAAQEEVTLRLEGAGREHRARLAGALLRAAAEEHYDRLAAAILEVCPAGCEPAILLASRAATLPGLSKRLGALPHNAMLSLAPGVAAMNALTVFSQAPLAPTASGSVSLLTELPWREGSAESLDESPGVDTHASRASAPPPSHVLYRDMAYPLRPRPLLVGREPPTGSARLVLTGSIEGVSRRHCTIRCTADRVLLEDHSTYGTFVNGHRVQGSVELRRGDRVRLGSPGEELRLIGLASAGEA